MTASEPGASAGISLRPIRGLPLFHAGDDLADAIARALGAAGDRLADGDVLVVAQKAVSKVEGRTVTLSGVTPSPAAEQAAERAGKDPRVVELILRESAELMRVAPGVIIARHRSSQVLANAGIDASNVEGGDTDTVLLWPVDPDASAARLRRALSQRFGARIAVVISDSLGRAWRMGTMGTAIGVSGFKPVRDRRGEADLFGRILQATVIGLADELAAAASLVIGEAAEGTPAAVVRGAVWEPDDQAGLAELLRPLQQDLFR